MSISHALSLADSVRRKLNCASNDPAHRAITSIEIAKGNAAKAKAKAALTSSLAVVNQTLATLRKTGGDSAKEDRPSRTALKLNRTGGVRASAAHRDDFAANEDALAQVKQAMSASGMQAGVSSLNDMATAVEPIIDKFDKVLKQPYLKNYNATLNSVPIVGLKDAKIVYMETKSSVKSSSGVNYVWSDFSALPTDAKIKADEKIHMFPYQGDFYLSIGTAVWKKAHIPREDPALKSAVNNWPALYVRDWAYVGDSVLPASNLSSVVPFAVLSADHQNVGFQLVTLASDGTISFLDGDVIAPTAHYQRLDFKKSDGSPSEAPKLVQIAYWNGHIVGVDDSSNSWNIAPNWNESTYTISDKTPIEPITELTANDVGPVGLHSDGHLWRRVVEAPPPGSSDDANLKWSRWIQADGVTHLGVASPGVLLDMDLLTSTLRSRYVDVQTAVYPVVERLRAFGITHEFWLNSVAKDAENWFNAEPDAPEKRALAIKNAKSFVVHSQTWSKIVSSSISGAKDSVNTMALQLKEVHVQLEQQLTILKDKLVGLTATLNAQNESLSKLKAAFWGTIAAMFLGLALAIVGTLAAGPWVLVAGGALFIGGLVATIALSIKISDLSANISSTEAQIRDVNTAIEQLSTVVKSFSDLNSLYGTLNGFWGRMANDASAIRSMDEATAAQIGADILADTASIDAARDVTQKMTVACQTYLDVLNKQGIKIPTPAFSNAGIMHSNLVDTLLEDASCALRADDSEAYGNLMKEATLAHLRVLEGDQRAVVASGQWFDVPALRSTANIWQSGRSFTRSINLPSSFRSTVDGSIATVVASADSMDGVLNEVRPYEEQMLTGIISLGEDIQAWKTRFPSLPTEPQQKAEFEGLRDRAAKTCLAAQEKAALANNRFSDFTNKAREYQYGLDQKIRAGQDAIVSEQRGAAAELKNLNAPWYIVLLGPPAVFIWSAEQTASIKNRLNDAISSLDANISQFKNLQSSGLTFAGNTQTWIQMSQTVSGSLGTIHNIITGIWGQLVEDPILYEELLNTEWADVVNHARDVLQILESGPPAFSSNALAILNEPAKLKKDAVLDALLPTATLGSGIKSQADSAGQVFGKLDELLKLPHMRDIVGYWAEGSSERKTLFDVVVSLRTEYVQMVATEYETIQHISSLAILQEYRAQRVAEGKVNPVSFVQSTSQSIRAALQAAQKTSDRFSSAAERFQFVLNVIDNNIKDILEKIGALDVNIENMDKALRDKILWIIADSIALAFATASVLVAFGFGGPIAASAALAMQVGASAGATAASIKLALDSVSLADIVKAINALKTTTKTLNINVERLRSVRPLFGGVVNGVKSLTDNIDGMHNTLEKVLSRVDLVGEIRFTPQETEKVKDAWVQVREETQAWMDVINRQGISPITLSLNRQAS